jgi:hypothetical protein
MMANQAIAGTRNCRSQSEILVESREKISDFAKQSQHVLCLQCTYVEGPSRTGSATNKERCGKVQLELFQSSDRPEHLLMFTPLQDHPHTEGGQEKPAVPSHSLADAKKADSELL